MNRRYTKETIIKAINDVKVNGHSVNSIAKIYNVPETTLRRYIKKDSTEMNKGGAIPRNLPVLQKREAEAEHALEKVLKPVSQPLQRLIQESHQLKPGNVDKQIERDDVDEKRVLIKPNDSCLDGKEDEEEDKEDDDDDDDDDDENQGREHVIYIHWSDLNELVDRLVLLLASKDAGNTACNNEILAIEKILREHSIIA